jgi:hypothetical protein
VDATFYPGKPLAVIYAAPPVASTVVVERPARRIIRERRVVRYRDRGHGAYAYARGYRAYSSRYVNVGVGFGPRNGWYYE